MLDKISQQPIRHWESGAGAEAGGLLARNRSARVVNAVVEQLKDEQQRWFLWLPVALGMGIWGYFKLLFEPTLLLCMLPVVASLLLVRLANGTVIRRLIMTILLAVSLGTLLGKLSAQVNQAPVLEQTMRRAQITGWLTLIEPKAKGGQRLTIKVHTISARSGRSGRRGKSKPRANGAMLPLQSSAAQALTLPAAKTPYLVRVTSRRTNALLRPGDFVQVLATISPPSGPVLPGGYDFARYAWFQQLGAVGYARNSAVRLDAGPANSPWAGFNIAIQNLRQMIGQRITAALPGETGAIANALITGERGAITDATNDAFRDSGLFHILSISGLHMTVMAGSIFLAIRFLLASIPAIALRYPIKKWAAFIAAMGALGYLTISGGSVATVRSYVMISIMFFALIVDRPALALRNVALAAVIILIVSPQSLLNVGFQMSFAAVVSLIAAYEVMAARAKQRRKDIPGGPVMRLVMFFSAIIAATIIASVSVAPFAAFHFHKGQHYALLGNLIAGPVCDLIVMPAALVTLLALPLGLEALPLWVMGLGIKWMVLVATYVANLPGAVSSVPAIPAAAFALLLAGGLWLCLWKRRWRLFGLLPILLGLALAPLHDLPDILIGSEGTLVAARLDGQLLSILKGRGGSYELSRWLEADGDDRDPKFFGDRLPRRQTSRHASKFRCDAIGCVGYVQGLTLAVSAHPASLRRDCTHADIVIIPFRAPSWCRQFAVGQPGQMQPIVQQIPSRAQAGQRAGPRGQLDQTADLFIQPGRIIIDRQDMRRLGIHAIYLRDGLISIDTVAKRRGQRPWSREPK